MTRKRKKRTAPPLQRADEPRRAYMTYVLLGLAAVLAAVTVYIRYMGSYMGWFVKYTPDRPPPVAGMT